MAARYRPIYGWIPASAVPYAQVAEDTLDKKHSLRHHLSWNESLGEARRGRTGHAKVYRGVVGGGRHDYRVRGSRVHCRFVALTTSYPIARCAPKLS